MSIEMTAHAYAVLDAFVYGFALQEATLPATGGDEMAELAATMIEHFPPAGTRTSLEFTDRARAAARATTSPSEFDFGLDLILDGLERAAER